MMIDEAPPETMIQRKRMSRNNARERENRHLNNEKLESKEIENESEDETDMNESQRTRDRQRSDAQRRDDEEAQQSAHQQIRRRLSVLNNRFVKRSDQPSPTKTLRPEENDDDEEDAIETTPSLTAVNRKRSTSAFSVNEHHKEPHSPSRHRTATSSPRPVQSADDVIWTPSLQSLLSNKLKRSPWMASWDEEESCGLYVTHNRQQLKQVVPSTLGRMEERLKLEASRMQPPRPPIKVCELLHAPTVVPSFTDAATIKSPPVTDEKQTDQVPRTAVLAISVDCVLLDDHRAFTLADRLETQLQSLYDSYILLVQAQPWRATIERIDAYLEAYLQQTIKAEEIEGRAWRRQTQNDAESMLQALSTLQQLHYQLWSKWQELQDCYRQLQFLSTGKIQRWTLDVKKRIEPIALSTVHACIELHRQLPHEKGWTELTDRLHTLESNDRFLTTVLVLHINKSVASPNIPAPTTSLRRSCWPSTSRFSTYSNSSTTPRFYVVVYVNGQEAARTQSRPWTTTGLIPFHETICLTLHHFPESVSLQSFECGTLWDTLLSTTHLPLMVPGSTSQSDSDHVPVASIAPCTEWYQFSSHNIIPRTLWHDSFRNSSLFMNYERHVHGRVRVTVAWRRPQEMESDECALIVLPRRRPILSALKVRKDNVRLVGSRVAGQTTESSGKTPPKTIGFSYERDFLHQMELVDPHTIDSRDPHNEAMVRFHHHIETKSLLLRQRDVFRTSSLSGTDRASLHVLTKRNTLLQLRDRQHVAKHGTSVIISSTTSMSNAGPNHSPPTWDHGVFEDPIPLSDEEITADVRYLSLLRPEMAAFDRQLRVADAHRVEDKESTGTSIALRHKQQLLKIQDFVDRVKASQLLQTRQALGAQGSGSSREHTKALASIIQEQPMPLLPGVVDIPALLAKLLGPQLPRGRRLRPQVQQRTAPTSRSEWPQQCELYIQIKQATNVPVRTTIRREVDERERTLKRTNKKMAVKNGDQESEKEENEAEEVGHVFVEVSFQGKRRRTTCTLVSGSNSGKGTTANPSWMETLTLPFQAPLDDWSPQSIQQCQDVIRMSLFDQRVVSSSTDELGLSPEKRHQFYQENRFLGSLEIPFATLYHNQGTLDASLRCDIPVLVGYSNARHNRKEDSDQSPGKDEEHIIDQRSREATYLSLMMTLNPVLPQPIHDVQDLISTNSMESGELLKYAMEWIKTTTQALPMSAKGHRNLSELLVRNVQHGKTLITRFLSPQTPPSLQAATVPTLFQLVRYVQLIPFIEDWHLVKGIEDLWNTSQDFLHLNAGDYEEHAVLLCNYFAWLENRGSKSRSYLVIGNAVPEGKTVYVLRQDSSSRGVLWNASRGEGYSVLDPNCPLWDVSLVVSSENIYANLQPMRSSQHGLGDMNWDIETNSKAWKPFFSSPTSKGASREELMGSESPIQRKELIYETTPQEYVLQVEREVKDALKQAIRRWRSTHATTTFNMELSMKLRVQLEQLENQQANHGISQHQKESNDPIPELMKTRSVCGMPLNTTFIDIDKIIDMVHNTNIHLNEHANVEFALSVYVHGYPNYVLSVWVYFVSLEPLE